MKTSLRYINKKEKRNIKFISKKISVLLAILAMAFCVVSLQNYLMISAAVSTYGRTADGVWAYKIVNTANRTVAIRPSDLKQVDSEKVEIPSTIEIQGISYTVTEIAPMAFETCLCNDCLKKNKSSLSIAWEDKNDRYNGEEVEVHMHEVVIPSTVTTIGWEAFSYVEGKTITFEKDSHLKKIEEDAFTEATFDSITIPASVTTIEGYAFWGSHIGEVAFETGSKIKKIANETFAESFLEQIILPETITKIEEGAFMGCNLTSITIPAAVTSIGDSAFLYNTKLKEVQFATGSKIKKIGAGGFMGCAVTQMRIPATVTSIDIGAFANNAALQTVTFETASQVKTLNSKAFGYSKKFDYEEDYPDEAKYTKNTSVTQVNVENYDVYTWIAGKEIFPSDAAIYSAKTRVFLGKQSSGNAKGDVDMNAKGQATISVTDYLPEKNGYHYENKQYTYSDILNTEKSMTKDIKDLKLVSYGYPYVVLLTEQKKNYYILNWIGENTIAGITTYAGKMSNMTKSYYDTTAHQYYLYYDEEYILPAYWEQGEYQKEGYHISAFVITDASGDKVTHKAGEKVSKLAEKHEAQLQVSYKYSANIYELSYDVNASDAQPQSIARTKCQYDKAVTIAAEEPTRTGYNFKGWSIHADGEGRVYHPGEVVEENFIAANGAVVPLYAIWNLATVQIRLDAAGGTLSDDKVEVTYGSNLYDALPVPERKNYRFVGWSLEENGEKLSESYEVKTTKTFTVHAQWEEITRKLTIHFSTPQKQSEDSAFEVVITRDGETIRTYDISSLDAGEEKIVINGAKVGETYVISCTNYKKENGQKKYYQTVTKEVTVQ